VTALPTNRYGVIVEHALHDGRSNAEGPADLEDGPSAEGAYALLDGWLDTTRIQQAHRISALHSCWQIGTMGPIWVLSVFEPLVS
jgi:hypothetical protein